MKIKDMEPQIDDLGFTKLEVKLNTKGEVRAFVCAIVYSEHWFEDEIDGNWCVAEIIVYDRQGKAYISAKDMYNTEQCFDVRERTFGYPNHYKAVFLNKEELRRQETLDLKNTDYELPKAEEAVYEEIPCDNED